MHKYLLIILYFFSAICYAQVNENIVIPNIVSKIAFGSCGHQDKNMPILNRVLNDKPDIFIWAGDNVYGDTEDMEELAAKYEKLASKPEFKSLADSCLFLATWDDHDYGANDSGEEYPMKAESKEVFLSFWNDPNEADRRSHTGNYNVYYYGNNGKRLQIIVLDTRTFRTALLKRKRLIPVRNYIENTDSTATILGEQQWQWLEGHLKQPADLRIIVSSIQFSISHNGSEAWANFPMQQDKLLNIVKVNQVNGVFFISGDVHWGELSVIKQDGQYPIYDLTSSGLTQEVKFITKNKNRIGKVYAKNNYGLLNIDWTKRKLTIRLKNKKNKTPISKTIPFSEISF